MTDAGPDYSVQKLKLEAEIEDMEDAIAKAESRLLEIGRQKKANLRRASVLNADLDAESASIDKNIASLNGRIEEVRKNLDAMVKES